jgi:signal transduction histidine kinase
MKRKLTTLSQRYVIALHNHLKQGPLAGFQAAHRLGRQAVAIGLETLDVARIHESALTTLDGPGSRNGAIARAETFFTEALTPIEKTHRAALDARVQLDKLNKTLGRRKLDLDAANLSLKKGILRRKSAERSLKESGQRSRKLLEESFELQQHLQRLTHRILSAQEDKRKKLSHDLQDEIAQTLLGINVRLLALKREALLNTEGLKKEIAGTQRLVDISVKSITRVAREIAK